MPDPKFLDKDGLGRVWGKFKSALGGKVDKVSGKGLSTNDYTTDEKNKLAGIATGATANVGTITGITMNGASKGTSGVVDLGTVVTDKSDKLSIDQGVSHAGEFMVVNSSGNVVPVAMSAWQGGTY